jgi:MRG-binding protein
MGPRKRPRISQASTPQPKAAAEVTPTTTDNSPDKPDILKDPWTDEEEILLFKSMIRWKPTGTLFNPLSVIWLTLQGLHKHFYMIAIANALSSHGFASNHTRIPGIWAKLRTLYDLDALDEREMTHLGIHPHKSSASPEADDGEENTAEHNGWDQDFSLPEDEFGELMWTRRFNDEKGNEILVPSRTTDVASEVQRSRAASSPPAIEGLNEMRDYLLSAPEAEGLKEILGQFVEGENEDEEEENTSVKDKGKKTTVGKAVTGRSARSTRSTPADEPEEDEDEGEEQTKAKPKRKRRR